MAAEFCLRASFSCRKSTIWDRWLYIPSEGRGATDFITLKIHRPRPGLNPRTLASTLTTVPPRATIYVPYWRYIPRLKKNRHVYGLMGWFNSFLNMTEFLNVDGRIGRLIAHLDITDFPTIESIIKRKSGRTYVFYVHLNTSMCTESVMKLVISF
jgi:hypothetical protein